MRAADSSVVVAAFASWHELHAEAVNALERDVVVPAHAALEAYSVLTRLPAPHRADATLVQAFLGESFGQRYLVLDADAYVELLEDVAALGISGGATYDALVAVTARTAGAQLVTLDRRAVATYDRLRADYRLLG